ncbi:MAG: hypothetical protein WBM76_17805 [Woeseiaceae bacterium]
MKKFSKPYEHAAIRKGSEVALETLIAKPKSRTTLARTPDDRWLSAIAKSVFHAGFNCKVVDNNEPDIEPPTREFSEHWLISSAPIYQPVTGASVARTASPRITMHG